MRLVTSGLAALFLAAAAAPASADMLIQRPNHRQPDSLHGLEGTAWWTQLARCAGFFDSVANGSALKVDRRMSADAERLGDELFKASIERVSADRGVKGEAAVQLVAPQVAIGRGVGERLGVRAGRNTSGWNIYRSQCLDVRDTYASLTR